MSRMRVESNERDFTLKRGSNNGIIKQMQVNKLAGNDQHITARLAPNLDTANILRACSSEAITFR